MGCAGMAAPVTRGIEVELQWIGDTFGCEQSRTLSPVAAWVVRPGNLIHLLVDEMAASKRADVML